MTRRLSNPAVLAQHAKNLVQSVAINFNRRRGREFVPAGGQLLHIEISSTCNLDCCFCAYPKKTSPKVSMKDDFFRDTVRQALDMGFTNFHLTPCTGDVFMDKHVFDKLDFLDAEPRVAGYSFFTNFTVPDADDIARLTRLRKLTSIHISIYGHDRETFKAITQSTDNVYRRLLKNLDTLYSLMGEKRFGLEFSIKSTRAASRHAKSELMTSLNRFKRAGVKVRPASALYNNWGGMVTKQDLRGLDMEIKGEEAVYKMGACTLLFEQVQIMATGIVNGCACRDAEATLRIGDLHQQPLREILSAQNQAYMTLIDEQQRGEFRPVCRSCDFYKSIYKPVTGRKLRESRSIDEFKAELDARAAVGAQASGVAAAE
ncbi:MAG: radical SAM/SPASM domain-containing protein [Rhodopseudomonas sp.]|uniref:radical SAM/SPASM domain-containing protein n=1 Tax=Rhodopseudomonas sp. TaxID=1078 RepID=UPI0017C545B6|nr:radical SAM/SPASM domain-containing protein [Rhodopseudomonas sp.]NVN88266.1 radical SAM/SPASM domain-containing protein [Rhodopseudomonas sp.]